MSWDVLNVKAIAELSNFSESLTPKIMTGIRGTSPVLFANMTAFGSFSVYYGSILILNAYEIQAGLNITSKIYAAFVKLFFK